MPYLPTGNLMHRNAQLLYTPECPHADPTRERLRAAADGLDIDLVLDGFEVGDLDRARELDFPGSPTVRVGGRDLEAPYADPEHPPAVACRMYGPDGVPPRWMIDSALARTLDLHHIAFVCASNASRSQIAEGLASAIADDLGRDLRVSSAGTSPESLGDEARAVLEEVDIDPSEQRAQALDAIDLESADLVVTLCNDQHCPSSLDRHRRLHWPFPSPGSTDAPEDELEPYRQVRDELADRLHHLLG